MTVWSLAIFISTHLPFGWIRSANYFAKTRRGVQVWLRVSLSVCSTVPANSFCFWKASSFICGILSHMSALWEYSQIHDQAMANSSTHVSLCTKLVIATARLLNVQCGYMKSYHWGVCSTDKGHAIFVLCFMFWGQKLKGMLGLFSNST